MASLIILIPNLKTNFERWSQYTLIYSLFAKLKNLCSDVDNPISLILTT